MKVFAFIFLTTFLVVGTRSSDPDVTTTEVSVSADEVKTELKTPEGEGQVDTSKEIEVGSFGCYMIVTGLKAIRFLENGVLNESMAEEVVDVLAGPLGDGLVRERAGNCTRKANLETGDCKIVRTFVRCVHGNTNGTETVAQNED